MPAPSVHLKIKIPVTVRRGISKQSHEKIGDCEQSNQIHQSLVLYKTPTTASIVRVAATHVKRPQLLNGNQSSVATITYRDFGTILRLVFTGPQLFKRWIALSNANKHYPMDKYYRNQLR